MTQSCFRCGDVLTQQTPKFQSAVSTKYVSHYERIAWESHRKIAGSFRSSGIDHSVRSGLQGLTIQGAAKRLKLKHSFIFVCVPGEGRPLMPKPWRFGPFPPSPFLDRTSLKGLGFTVTYSTKTCIFVGSL